MPLHPTGRGDAAGGRRPLPGLGTPVGAAPDDRHPLAAGLRRRRHLERALARRLHLPRGPSRRPGLRHASRSTPTRPRRAAPSRFVAGGHTPGAIDRRDRAVADAEYPFTLDLRRVPRPSADLTAGRTDAVERRRRGATPRPQPGRSRSRLGRDGRSGRRRARRRGARSARCCACSAATGWPSSAARSPRCSRDDGVTYRPHGAADEQPWALDPVPMLLDEAEWARLEPALVQRAELLDLILTDLYGPRRLLGRRADPAGDRLRARRFVRAVDQIRLPGARQLFLAAADLARGAGRQLAGAGRPHPGAVGHRLRDGQPPGRLAGAARAVPRHQHPPHRPVLPGDAARAAGSWRPTAAEVPRIVLLTSGRAAARPRSTRRSCPRCWASRWSRAPT